MKHIYIISIILSSFFAISSANAKNNLLQYAFYMPQDAFQYNTIEEPKTTRKNINTSMQQIRNQNNKSSKPITKKTTSSKPQNIKSDKKTLKTSAYEYAKQKSRQKFKPKTIIKTKKPSIDGNVSKLTVYKQTNKTSHSPSKTTNKKSSSSKNIATETIIMQKPTPEKEKSISEVFSEIPYPNEQLPKYKNAYLDYILSLRILYRTKKLQPNLRQEEVLSKANTIRRFDI